MISGISVVVVTYRRASLLSSLLDQIINQSEIPYAVIVVDNDPSQSAKGVVDTIASCHPSINFMYISNSTNSLTVGRNLGVSKVETEFTCLLDDDVSVNSDYLRDAFTFLKNLPFAIGVQGMLQSQPKAKLQNLAYFLKGDFYHTRKRCKVRWSMSVTYPRQYRGSEPLECQWISGSNQFYVTEVIKQIKWDENLPHLYGEDFDHSLRVSRSKLGSLYLLPHLKILHYASEESRATEDTQVLMRETCSYYLREKLFPNNFLAYLFYNWSRFAQILYLVLKYLASGLAHDSKAQLQMYLKALKIVMRNRRDLLRGDLKFASQEQFVHKQEY